MSDLDLKMTRSESVLWTAVRSRRCNGLKIRRQVPIGIYVVDFLCMAHSLIIEVDGEIHEHQKEYDAEREQILKKRGYKILRFTNDQVMHHLHTVLATIIKQTKQTFPSPGGRAVRREKG